MATTTPNLGLTKPATSDNVDITVINANMDKIDTAVAGTPNALAVVANGNTHAAIASGQYVYIRGHSSLSEGLYTAVSAISANGTLTSSNVSAVSGGGLNALNDSIHYLMNNVQYNANVDRNTESNRTNVMNFLLENYFNNGRHFAMVRYAEGYYYGYVYIGKYGSLVDLIVEIPHNGAALIIWRKSNGVYGKVVIV